MDIEKYVSEHPKLDNLKRSGGGRHYRGWCPFHDSGYDCFSINVQTGLWLCRSARCGLRGNFALFYKLLEDVSWGEVSRLLENRSPLRSLSEAMKFSWQTDQHRVESYHDLPPSVFQQKITSENFPAYLRDVRGFDPSFADLGFDLRWCMGGEYRNRIICPYYDLAGNVLTFTARLAADGGPLEDRYRFPPGSTTGRFLYGIWRLAGEPSVPRLWTVEGQFDVYRLATFGAHALGLSQNQGSTRQLLDLVRLRALWDAVLVIAMDRGAYDKAQATWCSLRSLGVPGDKIVAIDVGRVAKDPGVLNAQGYADCVQMVEDALNPPDDADDDE